jgi:hypothetical protein
MKHYEEFTRTDLQDLMRKNGLTRPHGNVKDKRAQADGGEFYDYVKLAEIFGCKDRQARKIVQGEQNLQRYQYNLLAFHTGSRVPGMVDGSGQAS